MNVDAASLRMETLEPRTMLAGDVVISEFSAAGTSFEDEDGDRSDWVELHNLGDETVDLSSWYLTDIPARPKLWQLPSAREVEEDDGRITTVPSVTLAPGEQLVIYASGKDRIDPAGALHTNFKLSSIGEYLALANADGVVADAYSSWPAQVDGTSYGRAEIESSAPLLSGDNLAVYVSPSAELDATAWQTAEYDDSRWNDGTASLGYTIDPFDKLLDVYGTTAYHSQLGTSGNQAFSGRIGLDFDVAKPITLTSLGVFDDGSDGFVRRQTVELWSRDNRGTPDDLMDDQGIEVLAMETLRGSRSPLLGGARYSLLDSPLELDPGSYSIIASGFSSLDRNGVGIAGGGTTQLADTDSVRFVGSRLGLASDDFPTVPGLGPVNHYAAGSFTFQTGNDISSGEDANGEITAYASPPVVGNSESPGNLGSDFQVFRPVLVTSLGVFDSGQDGIDGGVGVSLWSRTTGAQIVGTTIVGDMGELEPGTGDRFVALDEPVFLNPGDYTVVASGLHGNDTYLHSERRGGQLGDLDDADGAIRFEGTGRYDYEGPSRFREEPNHRLPRLQDTGPVNRWSAGTFKYKVAAFDGVGTNAVEQLADASNGAYVRVPFAVGDVETFSGLRLKARYDDGFVAYLNGTEVLRRNVPAMTAWDSTSLRAQPDANAAVEEVFDLTMFRSLLIPNSENLLAVHVLSVSNSDPDLFFNPVLEVFASDGINEGYFDEPTPGSANGEVFSGIVAEPTIQTVGGIVGAERLDADGKLSVEIQASSTNGAGIYYTTDGSLPTRENGALYLGPIDIGTTTLVRAVGLAEGMLPSTVDTMTYLFLDDVLAVDGPPEGYSPHWNDVPTSYGIAQDPEDLAAIAGDLELSVDDARDVIKESLKGLPTISLVGDVDDIFGLTSGFYTNPFPRGRETERPASVEYYEEDGTLGFQIDAGLRMMGWTSRVPEVNPRHSLRLVFRGEYGEGRLEYPLFDGSSVTSFDTLALRANGRDTWNSDYPFGPDFHWPDFEAGAMRSIASYVRDQWSRELQSDLGMTTAEGTFVHLYINGLYWGVYNPTERPDGAWLADHHGGDEDDYDSVLFCNPTPRASHGDLDKWNELIGILDDGVAGDAAYQQILGNHPDGRRNVDYPVLLDVDNFIDYMISGYHDAADDWPCNFYAHRPRDQNDTGFTFTTWDNDLGLIMGDVEANLVTPSLGGSIEGSPNRVHSALAQNSDYVSRFADRVQMHFFGDGALTPENSLKRWERVTTQVEPGMIAESARWGSYRRDIDPAGPAFLYTKTDHWDTAVQAMAEDYFPFRADVVLQQFRDVGLYPEGDAPTVSVRGGHTDVGTEVSLAASSGQLYYTLDGPDPRSSTQNITLLNEDSLKLVIVPGDGDLEETWTEVDFNHRDWVAGRGGIGHDYNRDFDFKWSFIDVNTGSAMFENIRVAEQGDGVVENPSAYVRIPFRVDADDLAGLDTLRLKMRVDDGFVAYLNGDVVARFNSPRNPQWNSFATGDVDEMDEGAGGTAKIFRDFDISSQLHRLVEGENVLAIHGMASSEDDGDFLIGAELIAGTGEAGVVSPAAVEYTGPITIESTATLKARVYENGEWSPLLKETYTTEKTLRISEVHYNPPGTSDATEFVEIVNIGGETVELLGVHFLDGIGYEFLPGDSFLSLGPGEFAIIAKNPAALRAAHSDLPDDVLIADRGYLGQLSNSGEKLTLAESGSIPIHSFTYHDTWFPASDGEGFSLAIVDPTQDVESWNLGDAWNASLRKGGSPGSGPDVALPAIASNGELRDRIVRQDWRNDDSEDATADEEIQAAEIQAAEIQAAELPDVKWIPIHGLATTKLPDFVADLPQVPVGSKSVRYYRPPRSAGVIVNRNDSHSVLDSVLADWNDDIRQGG